MVTRRFFKCFISSPGDCEEERKICQNVISELNNGIARHLDVNFETFMWEYDVLPDMGQNGQEIIDEYIKKSNYDIFIGIMKNRYGHPTKKAGSGTEHEFNDALRRKLSQSNNLPRILFFFGKEQVDLDDPNIDAIMDQHKKVKEFKTKMSDDGIYIPFNGTEDFEKLLKQKLSLFITDNSPVERPENKIKEVDIILKKLEQDLAESLKTYNEETPVWIDPIISTKKHIPNTPIENNENRISIQTLIESGKDLIIKAPSEFGLTSLAHYLKLEAWKAGKMFVYIDSKKSKKHKVVNEIKTEFERYFSKEVDEIDCILLDSVCFEENGIMRLIKNICESFPNVQIILFNTLENNFFLKSDEDDKVEIKREFESYYLLPLPQQDLRKIVTSYSLKKSLEDDNDVLLEKVKNDMETLNMHRTAKNCISILRASSRIGTDYSPINRTKLLETILNTIFEEYDIPTYEDKKPDIKDCSFVLGYLCELLVTRNNFEFSREYFLEVLGCFCKENLIELDLQYLLIALIDNSIFGKKDTNIFYFKNSYWVFYFIAQRMNMNEEFLKNIYVNQKYIDFPEIIEFYTGIDRNKSDAIEVLKGDIEKTLITVRSKVQIPHDLNPYKSISWNPDIETLEKEEAKISENVISSGLPDEIKDKYDDKHYNQIRPYNQVINSVIRDYSFLVLMRQISACSRALRNSDFVKPELKKQMLDKIMQAWYEMNKLLIVLSPLLADKGDVNFEGARFYLDEEDFNIENPSEKRLAVLLAIPSNIIKFFKQDLFSSKMTPLLIDHAQKESNSLLKHELMIMLVSERPKDWYNIIDKYIISLDKNSYYLSDVKRALEFQAVYRVFENDEKRKVEALVSKCRAKHLFKKDNPDIGLIKRMEKMDRGAKF